MTEPVLGLGGEADEPRTAPMQVPAPDPATPVAAATAPSRDESGLTKPPESAEPERGPGSEDGSEGGPEGAADPGSTTAGNGTPRKRRRRGSRGGRNRPRSGPGDGVGSGPGRDSASADDDLDLDDEDDLEDEAAGLADDAAAGHLSTPAALAAADAELDADAERDAAALTSTGLATDADPGGPGRAGPEGQVQATGPAGQLPPAPPVPRAAPKIGDTRPGRPQPVAPATRTNGERGRAPAGEPAPAGEGGATPRKRRRRGGRGRGAADRSDNRPIEMSTAEPQEIDAETLERRRGRERKGRPVGRYLMCVHKTPEATQIAILEGRVLIEHYVSRPQDDTNEIDGNIYLGRVQNVLPGMEAAFIDIGTPKNAVLYRGDVRFDTDDVEGGRPSSTTRIEQLLKPGQLIVCQVTKNPIAHKGARLTQEVSLPGRFVVFIPDSTTYGISKRLGDDERKRLRRVLDDVKPANHGLIVRTAAEGATADELRRDVQRLAEQWERIDALAKRTRSPGLLYQEPDVAVRAIREEFNREYRGVIIDDPALYADVRDYVASISPELADRVELFDTSVEPLPLLERHHIHEQLHKAIDRKVWLPSGGSLIIERTEALNVIDVNTGKNVGTSNLEETVYRNNLEAAEEIARQLRLRDIGGIIVIDFIDMEIAANRNEVVRAFREALARDKTRTQVFDISELGLVEMTRKRVSEGLVESLSETCPTCGGRGIVFDDSLL